MQIHHHSTLGDGAFHFFRQRGHILLTAAVDDGNAARLRRRMAERVHVHGHVAAADDAHLLAGEVRDLIIADLAEHLHGRQHALGVLALDADLLIGVGANGDVDGIVLLAQTLHGMYSPSPTLVLRCDLHAGGQDAVNVLLQPLPGADGRPGMP